MSENSRRLPEDPNLEQLRKQAKELLRNYLAGDANAIAEVERFERHPDAASFSLHDAQRILARAHGFPSWPKLKAFIDGVNVGALAAAVQAGDHEQVRAILRDRPDLVNVDMSESDERRALHFAVMARDSTIAKLLLEAGADARKGVWPHRDATSALALARDRGYDDIVAVIEEHERRRTASLSCPNVTTSPAQERVAEAIVRGDRAEAMALIEAEPALLNACDRNGRTPLHVAASVTDAGMVEWLLSRGANALKADVRGRTPLDCAALAAGGDVPRRRMDPHDEHAERFPQVAAKLLTRGAPVTIRGAVALGDLESVRDLLRANPEDLREISSDGGLVTLAVNHGQLEMVRLLLDLGADVNERVFLEGLEAPVESRGMPLWSAALGDRREMAELLLDRGADVNANVYASGWPLLNAWDHKDESLKRLLLARGAKVQPYMLAEQHDVEAARALLKADASESVASELAWSAGDHGCVAILELALAHLEWPRSDPRWHWVLIQPIRGCSGRRREGFFECTAALMRHGVDPNVTRFGATALHFVAARNHGDLADSERARFAAILLDHGARLDLRDDLLKSTPLGWACRWGRPELVRLLISRGAPVDEPTAEPWATPAGWAKRMNRPDVMAILKGG